jgi:hypothetical protein
VSTLGAAVRIATRVSMALVLYVTTAHAQVDPRGRLRTLTTAHLRVHYPAALDSLARVAARHGEAAWQQFAASLAAPHGRVDLLLQDNTDVSNGFAQVFPSNRVVIFAVPPVASRELRFHDDWLRLVITHELAHIFHIDRSRGLWRAGRWVFGRNPLFFPNSLAPSWVKEGLAVHYESAFTGSGRAVSTEFPVLADAAARDSALPPVARWSLATTRFPRGQTAYAYGSQLMARAVQAAADSGDTTALRQYVDGTAAFVVPFALGTQSRRAFGVSFADLARRWQDSLMAQHRAVSTASASAASAVGAWEVVSDAGFYAMAPRWLTADTLLWSASNGREVSGVYVHDLRTGHTRREAWRNSLDVQAPQLGQANGRTVFAQLERRDPYVLHSDLYERVNGRDRRLTVGARLSAPDVRADGHIVAVQVMPGSTRLVRVAPDGHGVAPLTVTRSGEQWAEPRWSPDGHFVAAVQWVAPGLRRVVVLDTLGQLRHVVAGGRAVFAAPAFAPSGRRLLWTSDRSGRMQIETAPLPAFAAGETGDTLSWRGAPPDVRVMRTGPEAVYEASVSPDGTRVVALLQRAQGFVVATTALDTTGPVAQDTWYANNSVRPAPDVPAVVSASTSYKAWRMLRPTYWLPLVGEGRQGDATVGLSSSNQDILARHAWQASALMAPSRREIDAAFAYRYAGLGVPVFDVSASQAWDGTFRVVNDSNTTLGFVGRRRQFLTVSSTLVVPRVRWSLQQTLGAQYERRDFVADGGADSALGPSTSLLRRGTRYPSLFANTAWSTARLALRGISVEEGVTLSQQTSYRWREDAPDLGSWRTVLTGRAYVPLPLPGYARHVLAFRASAGLADTRTATEFSVGGTSGTSLELLPGFVVGDPSRGFPVRGTAPGVQRGIRALGGTVEYRAPLRMFQRLSLPFTLFADRTSLALFSDVARAWCPGSLARVNTVVCEAPGRRDGTLASAGAELVLDLAVQYDVPYRLRVGAAQPVVAPTGVPRSGGFYVTFGGYF